MTTTTDKRTPIALVVLPPVRPIDWSNSYSFPERSHES